MRERCHLLAEALPWIGHAAIRNRGTIGGSLAHADPAAELPAVVTALDATIEVAGNGHTRTCTPAELFVMPLVTSLEHDELIVGIRIPPPPSRFACAWVELAPRHGDFALAGVAVALSLAGDGAIEQARLVLAGVGPVPDRRPRRRRHADRGATERGALGVGRRGGGRGQRPPWGRARHGGLPATARASARAAGAAEGDRVSRHRMQVTVNGVVHEREVEARRTLADFLRDDLGLTGTHLGCEHGVCGACTILWDGASVRSCIAYAVQADGAELTTVEGLAPPEGPLHPLQQAFHERHGLQCGYCTPGFLLTAYELLQERRGLAEEEIRHAIAGNLCRCTGYQGIVEAIQLADERWER